MEAAATPRRWLDVSEVYRGNSSSDRPCTLSYLSSTSSSQSSVIMSLDKDLPEAAEGNPRRTLGASASSENKKRVHRESFYSAGLHEN